MIIERIKTLLGITDGKQDEALSIIIENVTSHLLGRLKRFNPSILEVPAELNYIIEEISIRRYNRIGSEGMKSESVEGHRVDFYDLGQEFEPYLSVIDGYRIDEEPKRGKVLLF